MGIKLNSVEITLDSPSNVFIPGQIISGQCHISLNGQMNSSQLSIKLKGKAECKWEESYTDSYTDSDGKTQSETKYRTLYSCHYSVNMEHSASTVYPSVFNAGNHQIPFGFQLPENIPSSFEGSHGNIRYYLKVHIHKTSLFSIDVRKVFNIYVRAPAVASIQQLNASVHKSNDKTVGFCCWGKPLSISCRIDRLGQNIGTSFAVYCCIDNQSDISMQLKAKLEQCVKYHAQSSTNYSCATLVTVHGTTIQPYSQQSEALSIPIPSSAPVVHNCCPIIDISYYVRVILVIPGSLDLKCRLPVILTQNLPIN